MIFKHCDVGLKKTLPVWEENVRSEKELILELFFASYNLQNKWDYYIAVLSVFWGVWNSKKLFKTCNFYRCIS